MDEIDEILSNLKDMYEDLNAFYKESAVSNSTATVFPKELRQKLEKIASYSDLSEEQLFSETLETFRMSIQVYQILLEYMSRDDKELVRAFDENVCAPLEGLLVELYEAK